MSSESPTFSCLPAAAAPVVAVDGDDDVLPPPQPAAVAARRATAAAATRRLLTVPPSDVLDYEAQTAVTKPINPAHAVLAAVLQVRDGTLQALLWQRAREPFAGAWALPGGRMRPGEDLEASIRRQLSEKVDVRE